MSVLVMINCYVLSPVRSATMAARFPNQFLPEGEPSFCIAEAVNALDVSPDAGSDLPDFEMVCAMFGYQETKPFTFQWQSKQERNPFRAMLVFNDDRSLVFGLSLLCPDNPDADSVVGQWLTRLKEFAQSPPRIFGFDFPVPPTLWGHDLTPPKQSDFDA